MLNTHISFCIHSYVINGVVSSCIYYTGHHFTHRQALKAYVDGRKENLVSLHVEIRVCRLPYQPHCADASRLMHPTLKFRFEFTTYAMNNVIIYCM